MSEIKIPSGFTDQQQRLIVDFNLSQADVDFIEQLQKKHTADELQALAETAMQLAVNVELATIPLYLYTYYSIDRSGGAIGDETPLVRFANRAGATLMSVAVEEMLHLSLSSNVYHALTGKPPQIYKQSPTAPCSEDQGGAYPVVLPGHGKFEGSIPCFPLGNFSSEQLFTFLEIELPELSATPEISNWETIGQLYNAAICLLCTEGVTLTGTAAAKSQQIQHYNYTPNCIDTIFPDKAYCKTAIPSQPGSAAQSAKYLNTPRSHVGNYELITVSSKFDALTAITTICDQGEGTVLDNLTVASSAEDTHFFKFLGLQSQIIGWETVDQKLKDYTSGSDDYANWINALNDPQVNFKDINTTPFSADEVASMTHHFPSNPTLTPNKNGCLDSSCTDYSGLNTWEYTSTLFANALYQYMLIMTETIFLVPDGETRQRKYFNQAMHLSMIWVMDKLFAEMRSAENSVDKGPLVPTFEATDLGQREASYKGLQAIALSAINALDDAAKTIDSNDPNHYAITSMRTRIASHVAPPATHPEAWTPGNPNRVLPDVAAFWKGDAPSGIDVTWDVLEQAGIPKPDCN